MTNRVFTGYDRLLKIEEVLRRGINESTNVPHDVVVALPEVARHIAAVGNDLVALEDNNG